MSGVMAQQIALKIHSENLGSCKRFAIHPTSHLELHEHQSYKHVMGLEAVGVGDPTRVLTYSDVVKDLGRTMTHSEVQLATIVIELPQRENGGQLVPWDDLVEIRKWATKRGVRLHCDGTRLWGCRFHYQKSYAEICALFDSVYVSMYKEIGGMCGAMLVGDSLFIQQARVWLRRMGGNLYTALPYAISCENAFRTNLPTFGTSLEKLQRVVSTLTDFLSHKGYAIWFVPKVPQTPMVHVYLRDDQVVLEQARDEVVAKDGIMLFNKLRKVPRELRGQGSQIVQLMELEKTQQKIQAQSTSSEECYFEWCMGPVNSAISDEVYLKGWTRFFEFRHKIFLSSRFD